MVEDLYHLNKIKLLRHKVLLFLIKCFLFQGEKELAPSLKSNAATKHMVETLCSIKCHMTNW